MHIIIIKCAPTLTYFTQTVKDTILYTVNNKSFEGEKFRGLLGSSGMWGKVLQFFHHHFHTFMVFQLYKMATSISMKISRSSREFSLKLSLAHSEMDESALLTHVCVDFTLSRMTMQSQEKGFTELK